MNMDDNKKKLYDALSEEYDMGTFEQFCSDINDDEKRKKLYDATINEYDFGDYDSFSKQLLGDRYGAKIQDAVDPKNVVHPEWEQQSYSPNPEILTDGYLPKSLNLAANPANLGTLQAGDKEGKEVLNESGEQVKPENLSISNWPGEEEEYVEGFGEGLKQGWQGLKEGAKFFAGETANLFSGSSLDDERALATLERLQAEGKTDYIDGSGNTYVADKGLRADLKLIREAIQEAGGDMDKAKRILSERAADKSWGDSMMESAKEGMNAMKPTKGFGAWVGNLVPQMIPSAAAIALSFVTKNPKYAQMVGGIGMGGMTASTAGQSMKEARDAGATNGEVWAVGIADGVIEYATEKLPFDNYTRKLFNGVKHKVGGEMAEAANYVSSPGRAELEELLTKANKKLGGRLFNGKNVKDYLASIAEEGLSEFTAEALQTITPMIYENPENYPVLTDILSSGWEGAKAGLFMGSVLGGASKIAEHRQQRARRQEQGFVDVAQVHLQDEKGSAVDDVVEVVGKDKESGDLQVLHEGVLKSVKKDDVVEEHRFSFEEFDNAELNMEADESYQNGYSLKTPQEMSDAQNMYEFQRKRLSEQLGVEPDAMDEYIVDPINFIKEQRQLGASDEDIRSILDYSNAKQTYEGMIQRVRDDIDDAVGQAASIVQMRTNRDTGMVQGATMKLNDRRVYVVSGNVVQYTDGKGIDHANSDNSIIIRDAETNEIEMVSPDVLLSVDAPLDANELLMQEEQAISEQIAREAADKMEGKVTAWNEGDTYTITDDNGQHVQVRLVANELSGLVDNGDGTVNATVDGKTIIEIPKEQIQQAVDEANMARVASYAATNEAKEVEEKTAATLPEYGFNYKVTLQSKDGEEITGTIGDVYDDEVLSGGEREFVVNIDELSSSINGKRSPKLTQSELNDMVVSVQDADGNLVWQREDLATEAAENVTKGAEGVPENTENVPENAENVQNNGRKSDEAGERTDNNGIVMKDDGSPDLAASGALNALGFLRERYKEEAKVQRKIETTRDYYGKELEKVQKVLDKAQQEFDDAPFGFEDKAEAKLQKAQQDYDAVKREVDLWTELYNMLIADRVKENSEVVSEIEDMGEPLNGEELAAMMLINGQIHLLREDYLRETGYSNQEANKLFGLFRSKENGGVTVEQAGEMVMLADNEDGTHFFDEADANAGRNAVLEVLSLVHTPSDLRDYIKNRREQQAQRELEAEREYYENMIERDFHMTLEEYEDYVYLLSKENPFEDIDVAEIDAIFAEAANEYEEFFKQQEYEQGRTDEFIEGGNDVLPEERADDSPGTEEGEGSRETEGAGSGTAGKDGTSSGYDGREVTEESSVQPTVQAQIDAAEAETDTNPTDAQKEAGNYKKGHVQLGTFDISIEQPKGSVRSGVDADGKKWETKMQNTYGYIRGTEGVDGDHIDVFLANDVDAWNGRKVFVVDQYNEDGSFDEHKVMLGFNEQEEAEDAYFANYDKDWSKKHKTVVTSVNLEDFEKWIQSSHRKTKAFAEYKSVKNSGESAGALEYSITPAQYTTKRGKVLDMQSVTFDFELRPTIKRLASQTVRHTMKGWWDRERNGFMLRNLEDAKHIADYVVDAQSMQPVESIYANEEDKKTNEPSTEKKEAKKRTYNDGNVEYVIERHDESLENAVVLDDPSTWVGRTFFTNGLKLKCTNVSNNYAQFDNLNTFMGMGFEVPAVQKYLREGEWIVLTDNKKQSPIEEANKKTGKPKEQQPAKEANKWKYAIHVDKETGYTTLTREDVSGPIPVGDGRFRYTTESPEEMLELIRNPKNFSQEVRDAVETSLNNRVEIRKATREMEEKRKRERESLRNDGVNGYKIGDEVIYKGEKAKIHDFEEFDGHKPVLDTGLAPVMYEVVEWSDIKKPIAESEDSSVKKHNKGASKKEKPTEAAYGANNKMVTNEQYAKLRERMKKKLGQLNLGMDPEMIEIGTQMAVYHFEAGARKFADYAKRMIADCGDEIRPYLKSFYNAIRDYPGIGEEEMTPYEEVRKFDVANFDKAGTDFIAQAEEITKEETIEKKMKQALKPSENDKPASELEGDSAEVQELQKEEKSFVNDIIKGLEDAVMNKGVMQMADVKRILKDYARISELPTNDIQELVELALTNLTRRVAQDDSLSMKEKYDNIVAIYKAQPLLNARDSTRVELQQYSTPTPFGFLMGQFMKEGREVKSMLEPSAGNGALTISFDPSIVHANDIDPRRLTNLRTLGYKQVTGQDALLPFAGDKADAVATNPPFGNTTMKEYDNIFKISSLEGQMAINALDNMKDNGRAAIIIGGNTEYRDNGAMKPKDLQFFGYLYSHYNVADVINIDGAMYARNGTRYPVRIILIDGRKTGEFERAYPPVKSKGRAEQVTTFEELYNRINDDILQLQQVGHHADSSNGSASTADGRDSKGNSKADHLADSGSGSESVQGSNVVGSESGMGQGIHSERGNRRTGADKKGNKRTDGLGDGNNGHAGSSASVQRPGSGGSGKTAGSPMLDLFGDAGGNGGNDAGRVSQQPAPGRARLEVGLTDEKVAYPNRSQSGTLMSVVPANQAQVLAESLAEIGDVDQFLVDELGYANKEELFDKLAAEQVDSVALAIHQMNNGNAFIIGDMTGVGKGRQGAALIRYAVKKGKKPIYFTQKSALFADNYRDLCDIGSSNLRPFIIASSNDGIITDAKGNVVHKLPTKKEVQRVMEYVSEHGTLPDEYDYVLCTYDQVNSGTMEYEAQGGEIVPKTRKGANKPIHVNGQKRRNFIEKLALGNIMVLDESHTVGGDGGGSMFMRYLMPKIGGVTFLSATFAKRADNMPLYAMRTAISASGIKPDELIDAVARGGVTLQEIMSKQLVQSGQMIRRERSFQGVTIDWLPVSEEADLMQRVQFDEVAEIFSAIRDFQSKYIRPLVDGLSAALAEEGGYGDIQQGTEAMGVMNVPFASKMYNLVNQLLFALKADAVADRVIYNLKEGFKPVISFTNTMEGFLEDAPKNVPMDEIPNFSLTLVRALDGVMRYQTTDADGKKEYDSFRLRDLPQEGQDAYNHILMRIKTMSNGLPISPMDAIRMKVEDAGYKVGEITGRNTQLIKDENGKYMVVNREDKDKKAAARDFNNGQLDVLMINKSGSTGISLHASPKFNDQRQRVMVFAQFQSDINDEVQMRGRIDRTGQLYRGKYEYLMSSIPAEQRLQMMFKAKLKSLDANTTSSQKSKFNEMEVVDFLNKYGDEVVTAYMLEHPELEEKLGDPLKMFVDGEIVEDGLKAIPSDAAGKIARHLAFLPVEEQELIFKEISDAYNIKIQMLNDAGENDLEITTMPLKAKTLSKKIWTPGQAPNSGNAFADNTYLEEVEVDVLKKPMKCDEAMKLSEKINEGKPWKEYCEEKKKEISELYDANAKRMADKITEQYEQKAEKVKEDFIKKATKKREDGKNELSDEDIANMAVVAQKEVLDAGAAKEKKHVAAITARRDALLEMLNSLTPGQPLVVNQELDEEQMTLTFAPSVGMFLGFKFSKDYTLGSSSAVFATLDGRRKVEIPLSKTQVIKNILRQTVMNKYLVEGMTREKWDKSIPERTRKKAYIVTGNLMQALVDTKKQSGTKGYLVSYSTEDGGTKQGILMPDRFEPKDLRKSAPISVKLPQLRSGEKIESEDGKVTIERTYGWQGKSDYTLKVPKSSKSGAKYFADKSLRSLVSNNEFETKGNSMVAYIKEDNIAKVLDRLSKLDVTVLTESKLKDVKPTADEDLYREDDDLEEVNERFNEQLESLTEENAQGVILDLGRPGDILLSAGLSDREIRLYGNKVMKKIRKHGFAISSIKNLPVAINHPIAVFNNYGNEMNRAILTELKTPQGNVLATIEWGKGTDAELNIVTSVFGKGKENVIGWINKGYATYISKEKALDYLRIPAPIAGAQDSQELSSATKIVKEFENPSIDGEDLYREVTDDSELAWLENQPTVKAYRAMQVIDGRLYSPMASGKKKNLGAGYGLNKWDVATEMAFNVTDEMLEEVEKLNQSDKRGYVEVIPGKLRFVKESKSGKASLKFHLVTDETDVWAAYNPYNHNSDSMLNDQFKAAYRRGNIVVVEAEVPVGDLESGYQAPYSKDAVGKTEWKSGDVAAQFPDEMKRTVYLSRYTKPVRVLSNAEVAKWIGDRLRKAEQLTGKPITLYEASFHPEVKRLLEADGFTFVPVEQPKGKVSKVLEGHPDYMSDDKIAQINEALSQEDSWLQRGGDGSFSDEELSYENDPIAKWLGESGRSEKQKHAYAEKARTRMANRVNELAEQLHLDNVEVVTDVSTLEGRKARAKGWFSPKTGKIVVVIPNHKSIADVEQTVLHEAVAHYGLRKLFGKHFDDFLWNVYNNASEDVRSKIAGLAAKRGWDFPKATEEYLASLAEDTDFENAANTGWFSKIKFFFLKMLAKAGVKLGVELGDNELRYILWRSYENMAEPGRYRGVIEQAADIAKQYELGVGNYANGSSGQQHVADEVLLLEEQSLSDAIDDFTSKYNSAPIEIIHNDISVDELMNLFNVDEGEAREMQEDIQSGDAAGGYSSKFKKIIIFADTISGEYEATLFHENIHAVLDDMYGIQGKKIVDSYYKAASDRFPKLRDAVVSNYDSEEIAEEFFTYMLSYSMVDGYFDKITPYLTETQNSELLKILESIGYEQKSEIKERTNRRLGREVRESDSEGNKGKWAVRLRKIKEYLSKLTSDESDIFFREGEPEGTSSGADGASGGEVGAVRSATELYEEGVANTLWNRLKEGWVDYLRSAQQLQEAIEKAAGEKIADFENVYLHALHKSSVDNREWMAMMKKYVEPLNDVIHEITHGLKATFRGGKITLDVIETYLNCKHGLERNDKFAMRDAEERVKVRIAKADKALAEELRDAEKLRNRDLRKLDRKRMDGRVDETAYRQAVEAVKAEYEKDVKQAQDMRDKQVAKIEKKLNEYYKENRERDYSGLTEIFDPKVKGVRKGLTVEELERLAQAYVDDFEAAVGAHFVGKLWDKVREMNRFSLRKSYETGLISRDSYKRTLDMFSYYVPLRGFDGEKAADVYDYITEGTISVNEVLKHAKGRTSRASNLIATMMNMGNSAITQGNKNQVKNRLLNLANNHDTGGLLTVSNQWYEKVGEDEWMPAQEPSFKGGMTAEEMRSVVEDYEERMKEREALGEVKRMKNGVHLNVRLDSKRKEYEHGVKVKRNGTEYVVWVNGNPKAAQAINGLLNPEMKHGFVLDNLRRLGRFVSKNVTAFNPEFLLRNIKRDVLSASMVGYSKYGADYVKRFEWHVKNNVSMVDVKGARAGKFSGIYDLYHRYEKGALDMSVQRERWFKEFIENGGETGYSQVWSIEDYQREIKKQMKRHRADSQTMQAVAAVGAGVEFLNRGVENVCRFAAYCASRESGMNVLESVRDAKEASVNFNKKGSGALGNAGAKALFMFLNPSVQGFVQQLVLTKKYPKRMLPVLGAQIALGAIAVLLAQWVGDDDEDEDDYFNLNSHVRRSNFILRVGDHEYLRWDLPPDLRPWYGLGEIGASALAGKMKYENVPLAVLTNFSQMLPLDPVNDKALVNDDENLMKGVFKNILRGTGVGSWADAYLFDEDFMGRQITGATEWNKLDPEWKRAGRNTSGLMINLSKLANEATGGDDATSGWLNFNPSKLEHALKGTLGGWVDFPVSFCKGCEAFFSDDPDEKLDTRNYPIIGDTYIRTDNSRMRHTQVRSAYQWYKHEHDVFEHKLKTYNREVYEGGLMEYAEKVKNLYESAAYYRFLLVDGYMKEVNSVYSAMKQAEDEKERKDLEAYVDYLKAEMVKKLEQKEAEDGGMADAEETTGK